MAAYLEERESASVARESQAQHALQLWHCDMEGSGAGESLNNWLWQIGGEEAQLKTKHTELAHKTWNMMSVAESEQKSAKCVALLYHSVTCYHNNSWEKCYSRGHNNSLGLKVSCFRRTWIHPQRRRNQLLHHRASHQAHYSKSTLEMPTVKGTTWWHDHIAVCNFVLSWHWWWSHYYIYSCHVDIYLWKHGALCQKSYRGQQGRRRCKGQIWGPQMWVKQRPCLCREKQGK